MNDLRTAAQQALEALEHHGGNLPWNAFVEVRKDLRAALAQQAEPDHETRAELAEQQVVQLAEERDHFRNLWQKAQQAEPLNLSDPAVQKRLASQWGYVPAAAQAEPVQDQRCRAEPRSDGDFVCDCKIGECPGRSAEPAQEPVAWRFKPMIGSPWSLSDDGYYISCKRDKGYIVEPLYTAPPQRKPLTEEEIEACRQQGYAHAGFSAPFDFGKAARAVERAHGIKE